MDAAHSRISFSKIALLILTAAVLVATPQLAHAQAFSFPSGTTISIVGLEGASLPITSSDGSVITYKASSNVNWLSINSNTAGATVTGLSTASGTITFQLGTSFAPSTTTATVTLTSTSPSGITATITVNWTGNTGGGGGGGGTGSLTASTLSVNADTSSTTTPSQVVVLSTTSSTSVPYTVNNPTPTGWLTVTPTSGSVITGVTASLTFQFNSQNLPAGQYTTSVGITSGSQTLTINVTFGVIAGLTISPTTASWSYTQGGQIPQTAVTVTAGTQTFNAQANVNWILLTYQGAPSNFTPQSTVSNFSTSLGLVLIYNPIAAIPAAGTTGTVTVSDTVGHSTTFTVTFTGSTGGGGGGGTVTLAPNPVTLNSTVGSGCCSQATVTVNSTVSGTLTVAITSPLNSYVNASVSTANITAGTPASITVFGNANGLTAQTMTGTLTATVTSGSTTSSATTGVNFVIGSGSGGGVTLTPNPVII